MNEDETYKAAMLPDAEETNEELLERYDCRSPRRPDDAAAVQAVLCIILAALLIGGNILYPETAGRVAAFIRELSAEPHELFCNPIRLIVSGL